MLHANIVEDEPKWRIKPCSEAASSGSRVIATRWQSLDEEPREVSAVIPADCCVVGIALRSTNLRFSVSGRCVVDGAVMPGTPLITGPGAAARCLLRGPCDELHLHAPNDLIAECARGLPGHPQAILASEAAFTRDPNIERLAWTLLEADNAGSSVGQLYADCISIAIIARLLSRTGRTVSGERAKVAGLPKWRLKRAMEYIETHLDDPVSLTDLATAAGLTRMHFAAQFRAATGLRPHEYLLRRRVERGQDMLSASKMTVVDIALSVGFQTQSHFTTVFKRFTGQPPHTWRRLHGERLIGPARTSANVIFDAAA
jgi:AraC family transcriptional regulator